MIKELPIKIETIKKIRAFIYRLSFREKINHLNVDRSRIVFINNLDVWLLNLRPSSAKSFRLVNSILHPIQPIRYDLMKKYYGASFVRQWKGDQQVTVKYPLLKKLLCIKINNIV